MYVRAYSVALRRVFACFRNNFYASIILSRRFTCVVHRNSAIRISVDAVGLRHGRQFSLSVVNRTNEVCCHSDDDGFIPSSSAWNPAINTLADHIEYVSNYYLTTHKAAPGVLRTLIERLDKEPPRDKLLEDKLKTIMSFCTPQFTPTIPVSEMRSSAEKIWNSAPKYGVRYSCSLFNELVRVYCALRSKEPSVNDLINRMRRERIVEDMRVFESLIDLACIQGNMEQAENLVQLIKRRKFGLTESIFCSLLYGYLVIGNFAELDKLLKTMSQLAFKRTANVYTSMMMAYADRGDMQNLLKTFKEADDRGVLFSDSQLIDCMVAIAVVSKCHDTFDKLLDRLRQWEIQTLYNFIQRLILSDRLKFAWKVFLIIPDYDRDDPEIDAGNYIVTQLFNIKAPTETIFHACDLLVQTNINKNAYLTALKCAYDFDLCELATSVLQRMRALKEPIRTTYVFPLLHLKAKHGATINELLDVVTSQLTDRSENPPSYRDDDVLWWFWNAVENSFWARRHMLSEPPSLNACLQNALETTMSTMVSNKNTHDWILTGLSPTEVLSGFVYWCCSKGYIEAVNSALNRYPSVKVDTWGMIHLLRKICEDASGAAVVARILSNGNKSGLNDIGLLLKRFIGIKTGVITYVKLLEALTEQKVTVSQSIATEIYDSWQKYLHQSYRRNHLKRLSDALNKLGIVDRKTSPSIGRNY